MVDTGALRTPGFWLRVVQVSGAGCRGGAQTPWGSAAFCRTAKAWISPICLLKLLACKRGVRPGQELGSCERDDFRLLADPWAMQKLASTLLFPAQ